MRHALDKKKAGNPWCKEEVDAHGMVELTADSLEVEDALEEVGDGDDDGEETILGFRIFATCMILQIHRNPIQPYI